MGQMKCHSHGTIPDLENSDEFTVKEKYFYHACYGSDECGSLLQNSDVKTCMFGQGVKQLVNDAHNA